LDGSEAGETGVEVWRGGVAAWECDVMSHLNVRFYLAKTLEGLASFAAELGLPRVFIPGQSPTTLIIRQTYVRFLREARVNAQLAMTGAVLAMGEADARLLMTMRHADGAPAAAFTLSVDHVSMADRAPTPWPDRVRERAARVTVEAPVYARPRTLNLDPIVPAVTGDRARAMGLTPIGFTALGPGDCDAFGYMRFDSFLGRIGDGIPRLGVKPHDAPERDGRMGGAAVEYRLVMFETPRLGDRIELRSCLAEAAPRYRRFVHWLLDPDTGKPWGVAANVGVSFDLVTRKLTELSGEDLAAHQSLVVPGFVI